MIKKNCSLTLIAYIFLFLLFTVPCTLLPMPCFSQEEKIIKLMPSDTALLSQKDDVSDPLVHSKTYKFGTTNTKEKVTLFYEQLFKNEGLSELEGYSPEKIPLGPKMAYFFTKPGKLILLNLVSSPAENNLNIYYISVYEPDAKAVKNFTQEEAE